MPPSAIPAMFSHLPETPGVTEELIADTQCLIGYELPADLLDFYRACNGADNTAYTTIPEGTPHIRLNPMEDWITNSDDYDLTSRKLVMIGSDGGPFAYCLSLKALPMQYRVIDFGDTGQGRYMGSSLEELLMAVRDDLKLKAPKTTGKPKPLPPPAKDKPLRELKAYPAEVPTMSLSPSGDQVLVSGFYGPMLFDVHTGKALPTVAKGKEEYTRPAAGWIGNRPIFIKYESAPRQPLDPPYLTRYSYRPTDAISGAELCRLANCDDTGGGRSESAEFSPDGTRFAYSLGKGQFFGDPHTGKSLAALPDAANHALALAWNAESTLLAAGRHDCIYSTEGEGLLQPDWIVLILDRDGKELSRIVCDPPKQPTLNDSERSNPGVTRVEFSPSGKQLLLVKRSVVRIHAMDGSTPSPRPVQVIKVPMRNVHTACFVGDDRLALTTLEGEVMLYSLESAKPIRKWQSAKLQGGLIRATPDGKFLLTANGRSEAGAVSKTIRVWKVDV